MTYVRSDSVVCRVIGGETLIVPIRRGVGDLASIYGLNQMGSVIWGLMERPCSEAQIIAHIKNEFEAAPGQIDQDVATFLSEMSSAGLIRPAEVAA